MRGPLRVLVVEDSQPDAELALRELRQAGYEPAWKRVETEPDFLAQLDHGWDLVLADYNLPQFSGLRAMELLRQRGLGIPIIIVSGAIGEDTAVAAVKAGANDYVMKGRLERLASAVERELREMLERQRRRRTEDELRLNRAAFEELFNNAPVGYHELDAEGRVTRVNRTELTMLGYTAEEMVGRCVWEFVEDPETSKCAVLDKLAGASDPVSNLERAYRRKNGSRVPVLVADRILRGEDGAITGIRSTLQDVTERKEAEAALKASETRYRRLFEAARDGVLILDAETGAVVDVNPFLIELLGFSREAFLGEKLWDLGAFRDIIANKVAFEELQAEGYVRYDDKPLATKDGRRIDVEFVSNVHLVDGHRVIQCNIRDITERKRTTEALRESEARLRDITSSLAEWVWETDEHGVYTYSSEKGFDYFGRHGEGVIGKTPFDFMAPDEAQRVRAIFFDIAARKAPIKDLENWNIRADGERICLVTNGVPLLDEAGHLKGYRGVDKDITERKRADEVLRQERALYLDLVNAQPAGIYRLRVFPRERWQDDSWDSSAHAPYSLELASDRFCQVLGISRQMFEANPSIVNDLVHHDDKAEFARLNTEANAKLIPFRWEGRMVVGGNVIWVYFESLPRPLEDGDVLWTGIVYDITERKRAEAAKATLESRLQQAQKMESVGRLAGGVAHDFNNMLGVILGHTELALEQVSDGQPLHADLTEIRGAAIRSADLTRHLLAFARKQTIVPRVLDLNETVAGILKLLRRLIGENVGLQWKPGADLWSIKVDPSQIDQILANLCVNARDAISGAGTLTIETDNRTLDDHFCAAHAGCAPGQYARLMVSDTGCGMDKDTLSHLFEPFFTTKPTGEGTGLGLATVYGAVKQNRGYIDVYSEPGHGTTFTIYWPRHVDKAVQTTAEGTTRLVPSGRETILLVEDEPSILTLTKTLLERQGYTVLAASTPGAAIRLAEQHPGKIHLLLTDVVMPEMNGRVLARNLLALYPSLKRLFMSGYTADVIAHHGVLDEGVQFLQKPFTWEDLATKVRDALGAPN
jgi:PAS domain S-box-containing protein